ncbi:RNA-binding protein 24 isoform X2 [Hemicordylus capensis]|uniref:RNA-binding protein 24 isoform X2 n=1 Tax=Hemicordylus capensis TaxID=884348 RepID=UPI0023028E68|nr:RNA-binding protein 24 isoform X2 [Hemicordylus capensis]
MGCNTSNRVNAEQPSTKNQHHGRQALNQDKKEAYLETVSIISLGGSEAEDGFYEGKLPESGAERLTSATKEKNEQDTDIRGRITKKPVVLIEKERQTSSDILEELRMQGIIKTSAAKSRKADGSMFITAERTQKLPAKLEKLEIKGKTANNLTIEDSENKTREEQLKKELLIDSPAPISPHESRTTGSDIHCSTSEVEKTSNAFQLLSLKLGTGSLMEREEVDDKNSSFQDIDMVESDTTYNTINEVF